MIVCIYTKYTKLVVLNGDDFPQEIFSNLRHFDLSPLGGGEWGRCYYN